MTRSRRGGTLTGAAPLCVLGLLLTGCGGGSAVVSLRDAGGQSPTAGPTGSAPGLPEGAPTPTPSPLPAGSATAATASAGPGTVVTPQPASPSPSPTIRAAAGTVDVTEDDSGRTVVLHPGDRLNVHLRPEYWTTPEATDPSVLRRDAYSSGNQGSLGADFTAIAVGRSDVVAGTDPPCRHASPPCMVAQRGFVVHVLVQAGSA